LKVRKLQRLAATVGFVAIGVFGLQAAAGAQGGYPGPLVPGTSNTSVTVDPSSSTTATACGFEPYSSTSEGTADGTGCVTFPITTTATTVCINGAPCTLPGVFTVTGVNSTGGVQTDGLTVTLAAAVTPSPLAFTGADILAMLIGGLALVAVGFLILTFVRRRAAVPAS
jgi:hypothetical protein